MPDGPEVDGVDDPELGQHRVGQRLAGTQVPLASQVVGNGLDLEPRHDVGQDLESLGDDLGPGPVAGDHADAVGGAQSSLQSACSSSLGATATGASPSASICRFTHGIKPPASRIPRMNSGIGVASYARPRVAFSTRPASRSTANRSPGCASVVTPGHSTMGRPTLIALR